MRLNLPHFLFINGPPGSGKSTLAEMICSENPSTARESFAEPIREMIYSVFFPSEILDRSVDLRAGPVKGASLMKLAKLVNLEEVTVLGDTITVRQTMIDFSEIYMKKLFGNEIFGRLLFNRCVEQTAFYQHFVIDDSGFVEEASYVISRVGTSACHLIRLHRRGCSFSGDSRGYIHLPGVQTFDLHNDGSPEEMISLLQLELGNL